MMVWKNRDQFLEYLDLVASEDDSHEFNMNYLSVANPLAGYIAEEKLRTKTIKSAISLTHNWEKATIIEDDDYKKDIFQCSKCSLRASVYSNNSYLAIIEKVHDFLPTYDVHNEFIMYSCEDLQKIRTENDLDSESKLPCVDCGLPDDFCSLMLMSKIVLPRM